MSDLERFQLTLRERLDSLVEAVSTEATDLFAELDALRDRATAAEADEEQRALRLRQLEERASGQSELIDTLRQEADESRSLRELVRDREIEVERLISELGSKSEIITALRRQLAGMHAELEQQRTDPNEAAIDQAELAALRSELDARKAMIKSLRAENGRIDALEDELDDSRAATAALEATIDQHNETFSRLKRSIATWKQKYQAAKGELAAASDSSSEVPTFTDSEVNVLAELERDVQAPDCTVTIDMSQALLEARRRRAVRAEP